MKPRSPSLYYGFEDQEGETVFTFSFVFAANENEGPMPFLSSSHSLRNKKPLFFADEGKRGFTMTTWQRWI